MDVALVSAWIGEAVHGIHQATVVRLRERERLADQVFAVSGLKALYV